MKRLLWMVLMASAAMAQPTPLATTTPGTVARVADDGLVFDRIGEASKRDLPTDLLKRIISDDIEILRGKRPDGSYDYAKYERFEAGRKAQSFSIDYRKDRMETAEVKGSWAYRVIVEVPTRKLLVRKNRPVWIERVDVDMVPEGSTQSRHESFEVKAWLQPAEVRPFDLPAIARQATVTVIATTEEKGGYANIEVSLVEARIVDAADSPYAEAVGSAKAIQRALENGDIQSMRSAARRMRSALGGGTPTVVASVPAVVPRPAASEMTVTAPSSTSIDSATRVEVQTELQMIEDLLTGSESEKREGMDRLHQLIRRMRQ